MRDANYIGKGSQGNRANAEKVRTPWDRPEPQGRSRKGDFGISWGEYLQWHFERGGYVTTNRWNPKKGAFELVTYYPNGARVTIER